MIDRIHGGNCPEGGIVDFSVNINPLGLPGGLRGIISKNIDRILQYPDPLSTRLKMRLAELHGVSEENIALGNGSIELIHLIPRAFGIKRALMITPSFSEYEFALKLNGSKSIFLNTCEKEDFRIDLDRIAGSLPSSGAFFLCNPNNPTGTLLHQDEVSYIVRLCRRRRTTLVLDEAFIEFTEEAARKAVITNAVKNGSVIALRSLTKFFAMPGLRLGYAAGHKTAVAKITKFQYPWNVNILAQIAGENVVRNKDYMERSRALVARERRHMFDSLNKIKGLKAYPSSANFILCRLDGAPIRSSKELTKRLLQDGIYIRDCANFRGLDDRFFRVAVRGRRDNNRLLKCLGKIFR